jgi:thymidine phosphorylase
MDVQSIIAARRDAHNHSQADLVGLAKGAADGAIPDYQLAAWLMGGLPQPAERRGNCLAYDGNGR